MQRFIFIEFFGNLGRFMGATNLLTLAYVKFTFMYQASFAFYFVGRYLHRRVSVR